MLRNNALFLEKRFVRLYSSVVIFEKKKLQKNTVVQALGAHQQTLQH